jgi:hypothetical protein
VEKITSKISGFISSYCFYILTILLFVFEASSLAIKNGFPVAYDEAYHFGLIVFFGHHLNPIISSQPPSTYNLGAIVHNPSFLYYYLLSFPYRLIIIFTKSLKTIVILLRLINVVFAVGTLITSRKILKLVGVNKLASNIILLAFALTPIFTVLSSVINYENLMFLLSSVCVYVFLLLVLSMNQGRFSLRLLLALITLCMINGMVDFEFLPIFLGIGLFILIKFIRGKEIYIKHPSLKKSLGKLSIKDCGLITIGTLSLVLFLASYGYDLAVYHSPEPQCNQVLTIKDCENYYSWDRNYVAHLSDKLPHAITIRSMVHYTHQWIGQMRMQLYAAQSPLGKIVPPSPFLLLTVTVFIIVMAVSFIWYLRVIVNKHRLMVPLVFILITYVMFLWGREYYDYRMLGVFVAVQGRFLLPILLYFYAMLGLGTYYLLKSNRFGTGLEAVIVSIILVIFCLFGGYRQYITKITPSYTWQG